MVHNLGNQPLDIKTAVLPPSSWRLCSIPPPPLLHHITRILITRGVTGFGPFPARSPPQDSTPTTYYHTRQIRITFIVLVDVSVKSWTELITNRKQEDHIWAQEEGRYKTQGNKVWHHLLKLKLSQHCSWCECPNSDPERWWVPGTRMSPLQSQCCLWVGRERGGFSWSPRSSPLFWACWAPGCLDCTRQTAL